MDRPRRNRERGGPRGDASPAGPERGPGGAAERAQNELDGIRLEIAFVACWKPRRCRYRAGRIMRLDGLEMSVHNTGGREHRDGGMRRNDGVLPQGSTTIEAAR